MKRYVKMPVTIQELVEEMSGLVSVIMRFMILMEIGIVLVGRVRILVVVVIEMVGEELVMMCVRMLIMMGEYVGGMHAIVEEIMRII